MTDLGTFFFESPMWSEVLHLKENSIEKRLVLSYTEDECFLKENRDEKNTIVKWFEIK